MLSSDDLEAEGGSETGPWKSRVLRRYAWPLIFVGWAGGVLAFGAYAGFVYNSGEPLWVQLVAFLFGMVFGALFPVTFVVSAVTLTLWGLDEAFHRLRLRRIPRP